jgi:hypothetical protein
LEVGGNGGGFASGSGGALSFLIPDLHCSLLTPHFSLLTSHFSLLTPHF